MAAGAVRRLEERLGGRPIPETLISQYLGPLYSTVAAGEIAGRPSELLLASVRRVLGIHGDACRGEAAAG